MNNKQNKLFSLSDKFSSMAFMDLRTLCSVFEIAISAEIILVVIWVLVTFEDTHGLSIVYLGLFFFLTIVPQYIFAEMGLLIDKLAKNQKLLED